MLQRTGAPRRKLGVREPLPNDDPALIAKLIAARRPLIEQGITLAGNDPFAAKMQRAALAAIADPKSATAEAAAASAILLTYEIDPRSEATGEAISWAFVDHWLATRGAAFA